MKALTGRFGEIGLALLVQALLVVAVEAQETSDQPIDLKVIMQNGKPPVPIRRGTPVYPAAMRLTGDNASVLVSFIIDTTGDVQNPIVVKSSNPRFDEAAIDAIRRWKYKPAEMNGHPVSTRAAQMLRFTSERAAEGRALIKPPRVIKYATPQMPDAMKKSGQVGRVKLSFIVDEQGKVTNVHVIASNNPLCDRPAIEALMKWKFAPAESDGHPVSMPTEQEFTFAVDHPR